jgi:hypothetical protein
MTIPICKECPSYEECIKENIGYKTKRCKERNEIKIKIENPEVFNVYYPTNDRIRR